MSEVHLALKHLLCEMPNQVYGHLEKSAAMSYDNPAKFVLNEKK